MKSIGEWRRGAVLNEESENAFRPGQEVSGGAPVDGDIETELKHKVRMIMDQFRSIPKGDLIEKMKGVVSQTFNDSGDASGTPASNDGFGSSYMDSRLRDELGPKVKRIIDADRYKSERRDELERKVVDAVQKLADGFAQVGGKPEGISSSEEEPIARECSKVPSFLRWVEENESDKNDSLSEPQHKKGEENMNLKDVVEKRMMQMAQELESDGKGSRQEVLVAMKSVLDSLGNENPQQAQPNAQAGEAAPQPEAQAGGAAPQPNAQPQQPPAQG